MKKDELIKILEDRNGIPISGQEIAEKFSVSRNAIWKMIKALRSEGYNIEAKTNNGYYIPQDSDYISEYEIRKKFPDRIKKLPITIFRQIDSTNSEARRRMLSSDCPEQLLIACEQTRGRGHAEHVFYSPADNGIYLTLIYKMKNPADDAETVTLKTAAAIVSVIEMYSSDKVEIKYMNDVYSGGKKACGVLTEGITDFETGNIEKFAVGIGINLSTKGLPEEIKLTAGAIDIGAVKKNEFIACLVTTLIDFYDCITDNKYIEIYNSHLMK